MGKGVEIRRNVYFDNPSRVFIGDKSFINRGCQFHIGAGVDNKIILGKNVFVGMNVCFVTVSHEIGNSFQRAATNKYDNIIIEDGCWIGANATILPGCTIGKGTIVAAGSTVAKSLPNNVLAGGVPAKIIKLLSDK